MLDSMLETEASCGCEPTFEGSVLTVEGKDCAGGGRLGEEPACRATVVEALEDRDVEAVCTRDAGFERAYEGDAAALLVAAGRFADAARFHDEAIADLARGDPLGAARATTGRGQPLDGVAAESGLAAFLGANYRTVLRPHVGPTVARSRIIVKPSRRSEAGPTASASSHCWTGIVGCGWLPAESCRS